MNIKYMETIMEKGYDLNIMALLYMFKEEEVKTQNVKIRAIIGLMERKGLILENRITMAGEELISAMEGKGEGETVTKKTEDLEEVFEKVQERIFQLKGKKQIRTEIFGKTYNYFPNKYDFVTRLRTVINKYKLKDIKKVEKVLISNIEKCNKTNKWYPLMIYYLSKDNVSQFASDYEAWDEEQQKVEEQYDGTNI